MTLYKCIVAAQGLNLGALYYGTYSTGPYGERIKINGAYYYAYRFKEFKFSDYGSQM